MHHNQHIIHNANKSINNQYHTLANYQPSMDPYILGI
jgi:hypothetical protein